MKLLFILENYHPHIGGVEILFKTLCERLAKTHTVTVVTRRLSNTEAKETVNNVRIIRVRSINRYGFTFASIPSVIKAAKKADVIHTTTYNAMFPAWLASKITKTPASITVHETWIGKWDEYSDFYKPKASLHNLFEKTLYAITSFKTYVCVSDSTKNMLEKAVPKTKGKTLRIYNGFDPTMWKEDHSKEASEIREDLVLQDRFVIFAAGRPGTSKGFQYLLEAFPAVREHVPHAVLMLVLSQDKQYAHRINQFKKRANDDVLFVRPQPYKDLPAFRQMADCIVVPSLSEGFGFAVLESCATGTPVVATNTTSIPEVIYGKHLLVKPKDAKGLAKGILSVYMKNYESTNEKRFPWSTTVKEYESLFKRLT